VPIYQSGGAASPYVGQSNRWTTLGYGEAAVPYPVPSQIVAVRSPIFVRQPAGWTAATVSDATALTSPTLTIAPQDGDLVMVAITVDAHAGGISAATITPNQGTWTQVGPISDTGSPNDHRAAWLWRIWRTGDATALTFTCSSAVEWALAAMAYAGCSETTPVGSYASGWESGASTALHTTSTITPGSTLPWIGVSFGDRSGSTWNPPTGYTTRAAAKPGTAPTGINPSTSIHDSNGLVRQLPVSLTNGSGAVSSSTAVWFIFELVPYGQTSNPPPQVVLGPVCGNVSSSGCTVTYAFSGLTSTARLKVSTTADLLTSPVFGTAVAAGTQGLAKLSVTGLSPNTLYYYGVEADGTINSEGFGSFTTDPTPGTAANFSVAFGSCQFTVLSTNTFEAIRQKTGSVAAGSGKARRLIHMGDIHYEDWGASDTLQGVYDQWFQTLDQPLFAPMLSEIPITYMWDNHDWGGNGSDKNNVRGADVAAAYRNVIPHYNLPATDGRGAWQTWVIGRVRFIQIDPRSQRNNYLDPDSSSKSMLGVEQKAWLKARLQETEPLKVICGNMAWRTEGGTSGDRWSSFATEFQEMTNFINNTAGVAGKVFVIFGDTHALAADDGSTPGAVGIPQACGAPFQQGSLDMSSITYSFGTYDTYPAVLRAYGWLDFADDGTTISVTYQGITTDDGIVRVQMPLSFGTAIVESAVASLAVTATLAAGASLIPMTFATDLAVEATFEAAADVSTPATSSAALAATATFSAAADRTAVAGPALAVTATLSTAATVTDTADAALPVTATFASTAPAARSAAAVLPVTATLATATPVSRPLAGVLPVTVTLSATAPVSRTAVASLAATATLAAAAVGTLSAQASLAVAATLAATGGRSAPVDAALSATAALSAGAVLGDSPAIAALNVTATLTTAATLAQVASAALAAVATLSAAVTPQRAAAAALLVTATVAAAAVESLFAAASLAATAVLAADATTDTPPVLATATLAITVSLSAAATRGPAAGAVLAISATFTTTTGRSAPISTVLTVTVSLSAGGAQMRSTGAALAAVVTLLASAEMLTGVVDFVVADSVTVARSTVEPGRTSVAYAEPSGSLRYSSVE